MVRMVALRVVRWAMLASMAVVLTTAPQATFGDDAKSAVKKTVVKRGKVLRGRLPANYAPVVTDEQKEKIYKIQEEYKTKIDAARAQVDALVKEQKEKIAAVLTPDQKKKVEEAEAKAKEEAKAKGAKPKTEKPAAPAPTPAK